MAVKKKNPVYVCRECGNSQPKWLGRCPECGQWNSFEEKAASAEKAETVSGYKKISIPPQSLEEVNPMGNNRLLTGIEEFDRVLGGGAMKGSAVLIGGEPGIGKSTLLLQAADSIKESGVILYVSSEESPGQIKMRSERLGISGQKIKVFSTNCLEEVETVLNSINPLCVIIDSVQTMFSSEFSSVPGSVNQLKYCTNELVSWVKERQTVLFLVAHVTKEGVIAGPKALEHLVDTVITFEKNDEDVRFLRSQKNRFGSIDELGIFSMNEKGLTPVGDPSGLFMVRRGESIPPGIAVVPVFEGSRVFLVEIQALTVTAKTGISRVFSDKIDSARVNRVAAVLEKRIGLKLSDQDIYVNVAGGIRLREPAVDLALAAALYSARADKSLHPDSAYAGELSLSGEIRPVPKIQQRIKTAAALGFTKFFCPKESAQGKDYPGENLFCVPDIKSAFMLF